MWVLVQRPVHFGTFIISSILAIFMQTGPVQLQAGLNGGLL